MGNSHLRRETQPRTAQAKVKGKTARHSRSVAASGAAAGSTAAPLVAAVEVTPEESGRLAEDLAYFNVSVYREASPGEIRKDDIERAEKEIDAVTRRTP